MATTQQRLDRIEEKIDKLADAMISLARAEERISAVAEQQAHQTERLNRLSEKIDGVAAAVVALHLLARQGLDREANHQQYYPKPKQPARGHHRLGSSKV